MCFSATISFGASAVLIPAGIYALTKINQIESRYLALACIPFIFGLQQLIEGFVWHNYNAKNELATLAFGRAYLFFSHFFWMVWIPLTAWLFESKPQRKKLFFALMIIGFTLGLIAYLPLLLQEGRLVISVIEHSIYYETHLVTHEYVSKNSLRLGYAVIVLLPLLLSSSKILQHYGILVALSITGTFLFFEYAFVSVWCFFSAFLSFYVLYHVLNPEALLEPEM